MAQPSPIACGEPQVLGRLNEIAPIVKSWRMTFASRTGWVSLRTALGDRFWGADVGPYASTAAIRALWLMLAAVMSIFVVSCSGGGPQKKTCYPVKGQLFVKGQPAAGASLIFQPQGGGTLVRLTVPRERGEAHGG